MGSIRPALARCGRGRQYQHMDQAKGAAHQPARARHGPATRDPGAASDAGTAQLRFYAELRDLLAPARRSGRISHPITGPRSIKDVIESYGIPHTEVDVILVDGESVDFSYRFESFDIKSLVRLRPKPLRQTRFVLDGHLGTLARRLRLLGFDCAFSNDPADDGLVRISVDQQRILLTRDRGLLKRRAVTHGYCLRSDLPTEQLGEVIVRFQLSGSMEPFTRCMACNGLLVRVDKAKIAHRLPPMTRHYYDDFHSCPDCGRDYWRGAHHERLQQIVTDAGAVES